MNKPLPFVLLTALVCGAYSGHADAEVITATQDAHIRNGSNANTNYGNDPILQLKPGSNSFFRTIYLDFDVSSVALSSVISAELDLDIESVSGGADLSYKVFGFTSPAWDESTITWNNAPFASTSATATFGTDLGGGTIVFASDDNLTFSSTELTDFVKSSSGTVSLIIHPTDMDGNVNLNFHSSELLNGDPNPNAPTLTLTVPEPGSLALLGLGGLLIARRRRS
ncbi:MAG: DNRLRE domain-containing protein [Planctomycetota bacterium]